MDAMSPFAESHSSKESLRIFSCDRLSCEARVGSDSKYDVVVPRIGSRNLDPWVELGTNQKVSSELSIAAVPQDVTDNGSYRN